MSFLNEVKVNRDDLAHVIRLAALIEDRAKEEHRALVKIAAACDNVMNKGTFTNIEHRDFAEPSRLLCEVTEPAREPKAIFDRWFRQIDRYEEARSLLRANPARVQAMAER